MSAHRIAMVAGEPSGDLIAAQVIAGIQTLSPHHTFMGIGGEHMKTQGFDSRYPMDALSVFGYVDALKSLPRLFKIYKGLEHQLLAECPDVFLGVDAPDFNLRLEHTLRKKGIPTVHFVGPSIWAWRYERIHHIRQAVSHMLVLFPFEVPIYEKEGIPVTFVGHPTASKIPLSTDPQEARIRLNLPLDSKIVAILPGSRSSEIKLLTEPFLRTAQALAKRDPNLHFIVPMVNEARYQEFMSIASQIPVPNLHVYQHQEGSRPQSWEIMQACDAAMVASGTATLELALFKRPMVIAYKLSPWMKRLMAWKSGQTKPLVPWVGLPNVLLGEFAVPELLQENCTPPLLLEACVRALEDKSYITNLQEKFHQLHLSLKQDTAGIAAQVITHLVK